MNQDIYKELMSSFEKLKEEEKNVIILYQSRLFYFINEITRIENYELLSIDELLFCLKEKSTIEAKFIEYKNVICDVKNIFFRLGIFKDISFDTLSSFIASLLILIKRLQSLNEKIILNEDLIVYRGINIRNTTIDSLGKGDFISTSLNVDTALQFTVGEGNSILFKLHLKSPISVLLTPYRIGLFYDKEISIIDATMKNIPPTVMKLIHNEINS